MKFLAFGESVGLSSRARALLQRTYFSRVAPGNIYAKYAQPVFYHGKNITLIEVEDPKRYAI